MAARKKAAAPVAAVENEAPPVEGVPTIAASTIEMVPLALLRRAPENVRKTAVDVDVDSLADDIAAHGLLQSLIGYRLPDHFIEAPEAVDGFVLLGKTPVQIVGGGRRLQALQKLLDLRSLPVDFPVPVLVRPQGEAIEISLSENLARRDMNPADEFEAFATLMKPGTLSPADLARRFGFSERYVRQRLRLAELAPEILDAMRAGKLTLEAALVYARTQDRALQLKIFRSEEKKSWGAHGTSSISSAIINAQMTTGSALFRFVGARDYEKKGGGYEDDLFGEAVGYGDVRKLKNPEIVTAIAADRAAFQLTKLAAEAKQAHPTIVDVLMTPGLRLREKLPKAPAGCRIVDRGYYHSDSWDVIWKRADAAQVLITAIAGISHKGELELDDRFFVPADKLSVVMPPRAQTPAETPEERAARERAAAVRSVAAVLAVRAISQPDPSGRRYFNNVRPHLRQEQHETLGEVYPIGQTFYVTAAEVDAQLTAAEAELDQQIADEKAAQAAREQAKAEAAEALEARRAALVAMDPPPAVLMVDDLWFFRWESGMWTEMPESSDADPEYGYDDLAEMVEDALKIGADYPTLDDWRAAQPEAAAEIEGVDA